MRYFQCTLKQGTAITIGWIEERGARLGARVKVPELGGLWKVVTVAITHSRTTGCATSSAWTARACRTSDTCTNPSSRL